MVNIIVSLISLSDFIVTAAAAAKSLQSCPTLCDPIDGSPLGSSFPGILQARILEQVAIPSWEERNGCFRTLGTAGLWFLRRELIAQLLACRQFPQTWLW